MKKKILLAVLLCVTAASIVWAEARVFLEYPALGECKGKNVRIRSNPSTKAEVIGRLDDWDKVIVLREVKSGSSIWYEIDNPAGEGEAYVSGKYILPAYRQKFQRSKAAKFLTDIRLTYGSTPEKMLALSGRPKKLTRWKNDIIPFVTGDWGDYRILHYDREDDARGRLKSIEVKSGSKPFGNIHIGDSTEKLRRELGSPEKETSTLWEYEFLLYGYDYDTVDELVDCSIFRFTIEDGKVSRMYYYSREDGEEGEQEW